MSEPFRPHLLGVDDGPFDKRPGATTRLVAVVTEGPDLVEAVATAEFPVDGDGATEFLAGWIGGLRSAAGLQGVVLGGIAIGGLGLVHVVDLAERLALPVLVAHRREPGDDRLRAALVAAGLDARIAILEATPPAFRADDGLWLACAGIEADQAKRLALAVRHKSRLPEPLRLAHLIAAAIASGESRGRP